MRFYDRLADLLTTSIDEDIADIGSTMKSSSYVPEAAFETADESFESFNAAYTEATGSEYAGDANTFDLDSRMGFVTRHGRFWVLWTDGLCPDSTWADTLRHLENRRPDLFPTEEDEE